MPLPKNKTSRAARSLAHPPRTSSSPRASRRPPPAPNLRSPSSSREAPAPPKTAPLGSGSDFADLPQELLHRALSASGAADVSAASRACRAWRDALQPLREAAALHAHGRRLKHGPAPCGVEGRDLARRSALGMFQRAARLGSAAAMVDAGLLCWEEGQREEAMGYYRRAAELGHPVGMCNLGVSYLEADPPEAEEAVRWFYPAASAGNVHAQYNLGLCLQNGKGIKRNQREAAKWYLRAAEGGNVRAMYNVSLCYCLGEGFTQDDWGMDLKFLRNKVCMWIERFRGSYCRRDVAIKVAKHEHIIGEILLKFLCCLSSLYIMLDLSSRNQLAS
ncbi:hypothetical protein QYE76_046834 [Lolium multiflorum]|uniref:F-box protein n=1 Tax=Lolium multiflorum TaxID=4521 RepID=A0AAD8TP24_LOLMU|nr:hypothetical protein QYE76_046834 [Lolium multiflorum]